MYKKYVNAYLFARIAHEFLLSRFMRFIGIFVCSFAACVAAAPSDLSGDGKSDLIFRNNSTGQINAWLMNGGATTSTAMLLGPGNWSVTHTADFNGDGKADILYRNDDGTVVLWLMNGLTPISQTVLLGANSGWSVTHVADFNGDGKADILWRHTDGTVAIWLMNGATMIGGGSILGANPDWRVTHVADFNGDGKADLLWQNTNGAVTIWLMNGITTLSAAGILGANPDWRVTHTADLNGDGKADLLWRNTAGSVTVWLMNGTTNIGAVGILSDPNWSISHTADFNGDGKADLLWRNTNGAVTIWFMNGLASTGAVGLLGADPNWRVTHIGDYNGDGRSDIVWRSAVDGSIAMWLIDGATVISRPLILGGGPWVISPSSLTLPAATTLPSGFSDPGFTRGAMRTEYDQGRGAGSSWLTLNYPLYKEPDLLKRLPNDAGCLWLTNDPVNSTLFGCPGRAPAGPTDTPWAGQFSRSVACGDATAPRIGDSWTSCISYQQSNQFSVNWTPNTDYWVISANSEPSFDQCNLGPPNLSWPVADYYSPAASYFKAGSEPVQVQAGGPASRYRAHLKINASDFTHRCRNDPALGLIYTIPFLSVGAQQNRGQSKPIAYITNPPYSRYHSVDNISFDLKMDRYQEFGCATGTESICPPTNAGSHAGMYITAQWGGKNRQIFLDYFAQGSLAFPNNLDVARLHFNWPIQDSMFYPGAEIAFFNPSTLQSLCGITFPALPVSTSVTTHYQFNASEVFACASRLNKFDTPMPVNTDIPLVGVHWYVESAGTQGVLSVLIENMKTF
jgi:FG-GAP-like repeat